MRRGNSNPAFAYPDNAFADEVSEPAACASVAAVIVLYYPHSFLLARLIEGILPQVDRIFVVDNTPSWDSKAPEVLNHSGRKVVYRANGFNAGLASAQNSGIRSAVQERHTHVLLLDQDSALSKGAVEELLAAERSLIDSGIQVAAVGPLFVDEKSGQRSSVVRRGILRLKWHPISPEEPEPVETDYLIASGSLIRTSVLRRVGLMRDELFIDLVDTEWAYRARAFGYTAYVVPTVVMRHSVGDVAENLFGKRIYLHSIARNYYIVRNAMYLMQAPQMSWKWRVAMLVYLPKYILVHSWLSRRRWSSLLNMLRGMRDGVMRRMRPLPTA
jgi:rhamnosyltransferase